MCLSCSPESATEAILPALSCTERHSVCLACFAKRAIKAISLALHSVSHRLKATWNTFDMSLWLRRERHRSSLSRTPYCSMSVSPRLGEVTCGTREIASVARSAKQERHNGCVSRCLQAIWNTLLVQESIRESATEVISLARHSVSHCLKVFNRFLQNLFVNIIQC